MASENTGCINLRLARQQGKLNEFAAPPKAADIYRRCIGHARTHLARNIPNNLALTIPRLPATPSLDGTRELVDN